MDRPKKITFVEMCESGIRGIQVWNWTTRLNEGQNAPFLPHPLDAFEDLHVTAAASSPASMTDIAARDGLPLMSWSRPLGGQTISSGWGYPKSLKMAQSRLLVVNALPHGMFI
jgi:hypothetical protein